MAKQRAVVRRCEVCGFHDASFCATRGHCAEAAAQTATRPTIRPADATPGDAGMYFYATVPAGNIGVLFQDAMYQAALERAFGPDTDDACQWQHVALGAFDCIAATPFNITVSAATNAALESLAATSAGAVLVCHALRQMSSATAALTRYDNDADVAAAALDVMLDSMEKTGYMLVAGSGELRALVTGMRVAARNLASLSAQLERAWSAIHIAWATGLYKMQCGFLAVGGFELLYAGLHGGAPERPVYRSA